MRKSVAPICPHCKAPAALVGGDDVYPHRPDLASKWFWRCAPCEAYVGCHPGTKRPMGFPANAELRRARSLLHDRMIDPLWKTAVASVGYTPEDARARKIITNTARGRVYAFLGFKLGLDPDETHTGEFDLETCRRAWTALQGIAYPEIRDWAKARKAADAEKQSATPEAERANT